MTTQLSNQLRNRVEPHMTAYQSDLGHDETWIAENPGVPFIHLTCESSTHMFGLYDIERVGDNAEQPFLFGHQTPLQIAGQYAELIRNYPFDRVIVWQYYNGLTLKPVTRETAIRIYDASLNSALTAYRKQRRSAA